MAPGLVCVQEHVHVFHQFAEIHGTQVDFTPLQQAAQAIDHGPRPLVIFPDVGDDLANFREVRLLLLEIKFRRLRIAQDRAERLVQFVGQRSGQLAEHRHPPRVRQFLPQLAHFALRAPPPRPLQKQSRDQRRLASRRSPRCR